jgi:hypothetical protein
VSCDHKFVDSNRCLKCGWTSPQRKRGSLPLEVPPPIEAAERWAGILEVWGYALASGMLAKADPTLPARMGELTCVLEALLVLGDRHAAELNELYLERRRQPMPFGMTPPAYAFTAVRELTEDEQTRVRECVTWCQREREADEPEDYAEARLAVARRRWPDVAQLIGF